tara:strand:- start:428 stop:547 length:120 start_codon:yes stop_codon:yes gene_type:complete
MKPTQGVREKAKKETTWETKGKRSLNAKKETTRTLGETI